MRSLIFALVCVACGGSRSAIRQEAPVADDPELSAACVPDWSRPPPAACEKDEDSKTVLRDGDPSFGRVAQILSLEKASQGSASMDEAIVKLTTFAVADGKTSECGRQIFRWHRALAFQRLGRWKQAFLDFGSVIKDGPNGPFYKDVGAWIDKLAAHLPESTVIGCLASYDPPPPDVPKDKGDHLKPYTDKEPAP